MRKNAARDLKISKICKAIEEILDDPKQMSIMMQASDENQNEDILYSEADYEEYLDSNLDEELDDIEGDETAEEDIAIGSEVNPGIEDTVGNEASGGDPSLSIDPIADGYGDDAQAEALDMDKDVVVAHVKSLIARLDRVAAKYEQAGNIRMAYKVDKAAEKLEDEFLKGE